VETGIVAIIDSAATLLNPADPLSIDTMRLPWIYLLSLLTFWTVPPISAAGEVPINFS